MSVASLVALFPSRPTIFRRNDIRLSISKASPGGKKDYFPSKRRLGAADAPALCLDAILLEPTLHGGMLSPCYRIVSVFSCMTISKRNFACMTLLRFMS